MTGKRDVSNEIKLENGKGNPFGWSQHEIHHDGQLIGWLESGEPMNFIDGYSFEVVRETENLTRLKVYKSEIEIVLPAAPTTA